MRYRINDYSISEQTITLNGVGYIEVEDIRLVVNETQKVVICSSMQKDNVRTDHNTIEVVPSVCILQPTDILTIEIDKGDNLSPLAKEQTLLDKAEEIKQAVENIDLTSVESKVEEESAAIQNKIEGLSAAFDDIYAQQLEEIIG